jgi:hypothetical protein
MSSRRDFLKAAFGSSTLLLVAACGLGRGGRVPGLLEIEEA